MKLNSILSNFRYSKNIVGGTVNIRNSIKPVVLLSIDGFGIAPPSEGNAVAQARTPTFDYLRKNYPYGQLIASGESVGLPANEEGNSEVGHLTMGAGRVMLQSLQRINKSIEEFTFFDNQALIDAINHTKKNKSKLHIMGLVGTGEVHSSVKHLYALIELCKRAEIDNVYFHLFTDGRDSPPQEGVKVISEIQARLEESHVGNIASVAGRFYAMDRDRRWKRTQQAYDAIVLGKGNMVADPKDALKAIYAEGKSDEFVVPSVVTDPLAGGGKPVATVDSGDSVIFFNFRVDRARQITMAFVLSDFEKLEGFEIEQDTHAHEYKAKGGSEFVTEDTFVREEKLENLFFVTMTEYQKNLPVSAVAFPPEVAQDAVPWILAENNLKQARIAESEKEKMVVFYFNGMTDTDPANTDKYIIPSPKVKTYDKKPQMSMFEVVNEFKNQLKKNVYKFFMMNFAPTDMVAHTGNLKASVKAVEYTDQAVKAMVDNVLAADGTIVITADHGNVEELKKYSTKGFFFTTEEGGQDTKHSNNPVPVFIVNNSLKGDNRTLRGTLADIAPTILNILSLSVPEIMTGKDLLAKETINPDSPEAQTARTVSDTSPKSNGGVGPSWIFDEQKLT